LSIFIPIYLGQLKERFPLLLGMALLLPLSLLLLAVLSYILLSRLYFHPLAKIPGPKLAALTSLHEFYYDCLKGKGGFHAFKIREMHEEYGEFVLMVAR
jgi:hypothetical protein